MSKTTEQLLEALGVSQETVEAGEVVCNCELTVAEVRELCEGCVHGSPNEEQKQAAITALQSIKGLADDIKVTMLTDVVILLGGQVTAGAKGQVSRLMRKSTTTMKSKKPDLQT